MTETSICLFVALFFYQQRCNHVELQDILYCIFLHSSTLHSLFFDHPSLPIVKSNLQS
jgi:hypothetical protein